MLTPHARQARWYRRAACGLALVMVLTALGGCADGGAQTGNARVTIPEGASQPSDTGAAAGTTASTSAPRPSNGLIPSAEMRAVYQQIITSYVGQVDQVALVESAVAAVRETGLMANALPLDLAAVDLVPLAAGDPDRDWAAFASAYDLLVGKHAAWAATARPDRAVLRGMLATLGDGGSTLIEASDTIRTGETRMSGVGVLITRLSPADPPHVAEVYQNSPAAGAGLKLGDQILAINGTSTEGVNIPQVTAGVRGEQGTAVVLTIARGGQPPVEVRITRAPFDTPRVEASVRPDGIAVLRIRSFGEGDAELIQRLLISGRNGGIRGWVIDMRGNAGGSVEAMAMVATNFLEGRPVAMAVTRTGEREPLQAPGRAAVSRLPFAVVVDRATSSWAEVLAASIKEYQAGPVVGARTAGSVGIVTQPLSDGSAFQLTVLRMQTPGGMPIDSQGVQPDVEVTPTIAELQRGDDPPIKRAAELLVGGPSQISR